MYIFKVGQPVVTRKIKQTEGTVNNSSALHNTEVLTVLLATCFDLNNDGFYLRRNTQQGQRSTIPYCLN